MVRSEVPYIHRVYEKTLVVHGENVSMHGENEDGHRDIETMHDEIKKGVEGGSREEGSGGKRKKYKKILKGVARGK